MTPRFPNHSVPDRRPRRWAAAFAALLFLPAVAPASSAPPGPLRVCLLPADSHTESLRTTLAATLERTTGAAVAFSPVARRPDGTPALDALRAADVAVFLRGPGAIGPADAAALREFLRAGRGTVVLDASADAWGSVPDFLPEHLGATPAGVFAKGAAMAVINLLPHPIYAGVTKFESAQSMPRWEKLAGDAQLFMEGTVGEETTPLAWVRRRPHGRLCHLVPASPELFAEPTYVRIVANAVLWSGVRPIPQARPIVQRTFMPESHPGAFAITFPGGPGVCFDPVRGGINYVWDGDFVDLRPRWLTKQGEPARIFGGVYYREQQWQPLRPGAPDREADFQFRGYALKAEGPEFHYQINGRDVRESLSAAADGAGVVRRFRVGPGPGPLWINLEPQAEAEVILAGLERDGARAAYASTGAGEFSIAIRRRTPGPLR